jgi:glyceraldehyde-3-phosphate dehydrogenase (NADP+)
MLNGYTETTSFLAQILTLLSFGPLETDTFVRKTKGGTMNLGEAALQKEGIQHNPLIEYNLPTVSGELGMTKPAEQLQEKRYLINGELRIWDGPQQEVVSPAFIRFNQAPWHPPLGSYPLLDAKTAKEALNSAVSAFNSGRGEWPSSSPDFRIAAMEEFVTLMAEKREEVVSLIMWEICKSRSDAEKEFDRTLDYIRESMEGLRKVDKESQTITEREGVYARISRAPKGVVLSMGPFNYPLNETFTTLMPALLMGNTAVVKLPKQGLLLFSPLLEVFQKAFPPGVVNLISGEGSEVIPPIMASGKIDVLAFIGSSKVASILIKQHPAVHRLTPVLGLGAKNPGIIFRDADMKTAAKECVKGALSYNGQRCTALKVLFVERSSADAFLSAFREEVAKLKAGQPWEENVAITPLVEPGKVEYLNDLVQDAVQKGAKIINSNGKKSEDNLFIPAVLYPVDSSMRAFQEEQFGPVVPIVPFDTIEQLESVIADSPYGQQASIFTTSSSVLDRLVPSLLRLTGGRVNINAQSQRGPDTLPFGGRKDSGLGALSIREALNIFSNPVVLAGREEKWVERAAM